MIVAGRRSLPLGPERRSPEPDTHVHDVPSERPTPAPRRPACQTAISANISFGTGKSSYWKPVAAVLMFSST